MTMPLRNMTVPTWLAALVGILLAGSVLYGIVVLDSLLPVVTVWGGVLSAALSVIVVYLFYRLVLAVETIAENS